jgi:aspartate/methionine/tyrosine aminotransferase
MADDAYYPALRDKFDAKRRSFGEGIRELGFDIYDSGSAFYLWSKIPEQFNDALTFNEMLMEKAGVGMTPAAHSPTTTCGTVMSASASLARTRSSKVRWRN